MMNLSTLIVAGILTVLVILDIRYLLKNGIDGCSGDCADCHGSCTWQKDIKKAQKAMKRRKKIRQLLGMR